MSLNAKVNEKENVYFWYFIERQINKKKTNHTAMVCIQALRESNKVHVYFRGTNSASLVYNFSTYILTQSWIARSFLYFVLSSFASFCSSFWCNSSEKDQFRWIMSREWIEESKCFQPSLSAHVRCTMWGVRCVMWDVSCYVFMLCYFQK